MPFGRTPCSTGLLAAAPSSWLRAASSFSWPTPARSINMKSKPVTLPSSITEGGGTTNNMASRTVLRKWALARAATARAFRLAAPRSSQSRSLMNRMDAFWPRPPKLKPLTANTEVTASFSSSSRYLVASSMTALVRSAVAPDGVWIWAKRMPWSSSGRNAVGMRVNIQAMAMTMAR